MMELMKLKVPIDEKSIAKLTTVLPAGNTVMPQL